MSYAEVAVVTDQPFQQAFTYRVPDGMAVAPGDAVRVPFGKHILSGVVLGIAEHSAYAGDTRDVTLAGESLMLPHQVEMVRWLAARYFASMYACTALALPPETARRLAETVVWTGAPDPPDLTPADARLLARLRSSGRATPATLRRTFSGPADAAVDRFVALGVARRTVALPPPPAAAPIALSRPSAPPPLSDAQRDAVEQITAAIARRAPDAFLLHGVTGSGKTEVYLGAIDAAHARGRRAILLVPEISLTPQTVQRVEARFPGRVAVSHSGMTAAQRYRQWHEVRAGRCIVVVGARGALFLPQPDLGLIVLDEEHDASYKQTDPAPRYHARDAALKLAALTDATVVLGSATPDVVSFYRAARGRYTLLALPDRVTGGSGERGVGSGEREGAATRARDGGNESIDGEGKGGDTARDRISGSRVGERVFAREPARVAEAKPAYPASVAEVGRKAPPEMPPVMVVDLAAELRAGNRGIFSRALEAALTETLRNGEQAILFLNRRGSASFVLCRDCGHTPRCTGCLVPFTYHADPPRLCCHHCNRTRRAPERCAECGGARIRQFGLGTQKVEEEVSARWPAARVLRWDRDTIRAGADHASILAAFAGREADVLVGTQMVTKGLDLPGVTLVGVVSADVALNLPDFRAGERAFQILTQVAGRAGRGDRPGRVIVQTYSPGHYAVRAAAQHDYTAMYKEEISARQKAGYPPFGRLARLVYAHTNAGHAEEEARRLAAELRTAIRERGIPGAEVIGPAPALFARLKGRWRWHITLRAADPAEMLSAVALPRGWVVDVDPVNLM